MSLLMYLCPVKFKFARKKFSTSSVRILDIGCGNHSPVITKHWFPGSYYAGADIQQYNNNDQDMAAMDTFYLLGVDGTGLDKIPDGGFDFIIMNHVIEHMDDSAAKLAMICKKLKPGGYIWIAFPSRHSLSLPSAEGTLQFCDDQTHVYVPDFREVSNILLANGTRVIHAGQSRDFIREVIGAFLLPWKYLKRLVTGKLSAKGLWMILGFEDHVLGQRIKK